MRTEPQQSPREWEEHEARLADEEEYWASVEKHLPPPVVQEKENHD